MGRDGPGIGTGRLSLVFLDTFAPVQAVGDLDGAPFCFRARGNSWSFAIAQSPGSDPWAVMASLAPGWRQAGAWTCDNAGCAHRYCAGIMPKTLARALIVASARIWLGAADRQGVVQ